MANVRIQCRSHEGGIFSIPPRRGRRPVRCTPENPCDRRLTNRPEPADKEHTITVEGREMPLRAPTVSNPCLPPAKAAKERLVAAGWVVHGKGGITLDGDAWAEITASREQETLLMGWNNGELTHQQYFMEFLNPEENHSPPTKLHFEPSELTDSELVRMIKGMKVTWWNTIGHSEERAVVGGNVTIEHIFFANGDEDNSKRIVKFLDHSGGGFRAFHVSALLKVG